VGYTGGGDVFSDTAAGLKGDTIQGFLSSDQIDITDMLASTAVLTTAASGANTLVTVVSGTVKTSFLMQGVWDQAGFMRSPDAGNGVVFTHS
jgi:hypothetical protein